MNSVTRYALSEEKSRSPKQSVTFYILGFDRPGFTHDILKAVNHEEETSVEAVQLESSGLRAEGFLQLQVAHPAVIPQILQRLKVVTGTVFVRQHPTA